MTTVQDIQQLITDLPAEESDRLRKWCIARDRGTEVGSAGEVGDGGAPFDDDVTPRREYPPEVSLEELIRQQGVKPFRSIEDMYRHWPEVADPDDLLKFLDESKAEERELLARKGDSWDLGE